MHLKVQKARVKRFSLRAPTNDILTGMISVELDGLDAEVVAVKEDPPEAVPSSILSRKAASPNSPINMTASTLLLADDFLSNNPVDELDRYLSSIEEKTPFASPKSISSRSSNASRENLSDFSAISPVEAKETAELGIISSWIEKLTERLRITLSNSKISLILSSGEAVNVNVKDLKFCDQSILEFASLRVSHHTSELLQRQCTENPILMQKLVILDGISISGPEKYGFTITSGNHAEAVLLKIPDKKIFVDAYFSNLTVNVSPVNFALYLSFMSRFSSEYLKPFESYSSELSQQVSPIPLSSVALSPGFSNAVLDSGIELSKQQPKLQSRRTYPNDAIAPQMEQSIDDSFLHEPYFDGPASSDIFYSVIDNLLLAGNSQNVPFNNLGNGLQNADDSNERNKVFVENIRLVLGRDVIEIEKALFGSRKYSINTIRMKDTIHLSEVTGGIGEVCVNFVEVSALRVLEITKFFQPESEPMDNGKQKSRRLREQLLLYKMSFLPALNIRIALIRVHYLDLALQIEKAFCNRENVGFEALVLYIESSTSSEQLVQLEEATFLVTGNDDVVNKYQSFAKSPFENSKNIVQGIELRPSIGDVKLLRDFVNDQKSTDLTLMCDIKKCSVKLIPLILKLGSILPSSSYCSGTDMSNRSFYELYWSRIDCSLGLKLRDFECEINLNIYDLPCNTLILHDQEAFIPGELLRKKQHSYFAWWIGTVDLGSKSDVLLTKNIQQFACDHPMYNYMLKVVYVYENSSGVEKLGRYESTNSRAGVNICFHNTLADVSTIKSNLLLLLKKRESVIEPFLPLLGIVEEASWVTSFGQFVDFLRQYFYPLNFPEDHNSTLSSNQLPGDSLWAPAQISVTDCQFVIDNFLSPKSLDDTSKPRNTICAHLHSVSILLPYLDNLPTVKSPKPKALSIPPETTLDSCSQLIPFKIFMYMDELTILVNNNLRWAAFESVSLIFHSIPGDAFAPSDIEEQDLSSAMETCHDISNRISYHKRYYLDILGDKIRINFPRTLYHRFIEWCFQDSTIKKPVEGEREENVDLLELRDSLNKTSLRPPIETTSQDISQKPFSLHDNHFGELLVTGSDDEVVDLRLGSSPFTGTEAETIPLPTADSVKSESNYNLDFQADYMTDINRPKIYPTCRSLFADERRILERQNPSKWYIHTTIKGLEVFLQTDDVSSIGYVKILANDWLLDYELFPREFKNDARRPIKGKDSSSVYHVASALTGSCKSFHVEDHVVLSLWKTFAMSSVEYSRSRSYGGEFAECNNAFNALTWNLLAVYPNKFSDLEKSKLEYRMQLELSPLRFYIDQDTLLYLLEYFSFTDSERAVASPPDQSTTAGNGKFFQIVKISAIPLVIDYKPKKVSLSSLLLSQDYSQLLNLAPLSKLSLTLPAVKMIGISGGFSTLFKRIVKEEYQTKVLNGAVVLKDVVVKGIRPVRIGKSVLDVLVNGMLVPALCMPSKQLAKRSGHSRRFSEPVLSKPSSYKSHGPEASFEPPSATADSLKTLAKETLNLATQGFVSAQSLLERADQYFLYSPTSMTEKQQGVPEVFPGVTSKSRKHEDLSKYSGAPIDLQEGLSQAKSEFVQFRPDSLKKNESLFSGPNSRLDETRPRSSVMTPVLKMAKASSRAAMGVQASLDPEISKEWKEKYK